MAGKRLTKQAQLKEFIKKQILTGQYQPGRKLPTERFFCEMFDISRITVQTALGDLAQEGILYRIRGSGFYVSENAYGHARANVINAGLLPFIANCLEAYSRYLDIIKGIEDYAAVRNSFVTVHSTNQEPALERAVIQNIRSKQIDTVVIYNPHNEAGFYYDLMQQGMNFIFIDGSTRKMTTHSVRCDNVQGGYMMASYLFRQGFRRIALLGGAGASINIQDRTYGFEMAHESAGVPFDSQYECPFENVQSHTSILPELRVELHRIFSLPEPPDALFCINDMTAVMAYGVLQQMGIRVPDDVALAGFDNLAVAQNNPVPITTIEQPFYDLGYYAADLAFRAASNDIRGYASLYLPGRLIERESTMTAAQKTAEAAASGSPAPAADKRVV